MHTILYIPWSGELWNMLYLLICIQMVGLVKGIVGSFIRGNPIMIFTSLYSSLYITSLLPAKVWAILTIRKRSWGTSGRKNLLASYQALIPARRMERTCIWESASPSILRIGWSCL